MAARKPKRWLIVAATLARLNQIRHFEAFLRTQDIDFERDDPDSPIYWLKCSAATAQYVEAWLAGFTLACQIHAPHNTAP